MGETWEQTLAMMAATLYEGIKSRNVGGCIDDNVKVSVRIARALALEVRRTRPALSLKKDK